MEPFGTERIANSLTWAAARRADLSVAELLLAGASPDGVYGISHARIVDQFLFFVEERGVGALVRGLRPTGIRREVVPAELGVMLYFLRCLARIPSQDALPDLLFADTALMLRMGFNAHQVTEGVTKRGAYRRRGPRRNAPIDPETISKWVGRLNVAEVSRVLRDVLALLWRAQPVVSEAGLFVIDGSFVEPGESVVGSGRTSRSKSVRTTEGVKTVKEVTVGFKMIWLWSVETGLPVAMRMTTAEVDEKTAVMALLADARIVLGERCRIGTLLIDRGFLAGPALWALDRAGIEFVIPAKHDLKVYEEARRAASGAAKSHVTHARSGIQTRTRTTRHRQATRGPLREEQRVTEAVGVEGCTTFTTYAPADDVVEGEHKRKYRKDFVPKRINAVVLTREDGRDEVDLVLLTNKSVRKPLATLDNYDDRSLIENQGHRDLKQFWHLERPPRRTKEATEIHLCFVLMAYALTQAYRAWLDAQVREEDAGRPATLGEHVRRVEAENRDKVLIFVGEQFGIFYTCEFSMLLGRAVRQPNPKAAPTVEALLDRLRASPTSG
jgi:hypothetical protein